MTANSHHRLPLSGLSRPITVSQEHLEDLALDVDEGPRPGAGLPVELPASLLEALADPVFEGARPRVWEPAGEYLVRLAQRAHATRASADFRNALGWTLLGRLDFDSEHEDTRYTAWVDQLVRGYGNLDLLGFLLVQPSRADMEAHFDRLPEPMRGLARRFDACCVCAREAQALQDALTAARADGFSRLQPHLRGEDAERKARFLDVTPDEGFLDVFFSNTIRYRYHPPHVPELRGPPARALPPQRPSWDMRRVYPWLGGCLTFLLFAVSLLALGALLGGQR